MKGYLSVPGGIIHLLIELTLHTAPSKSLETKLLLSPRLLLLLLLLLLQTPWLSPISPLTHLPLCAALRVNILFSPSLFHTLLFTYSSIVGCFFFFFLLISMRVPSIPRSCQDSLEFGPCLQGRTSAPVPLNAVPFKKRRRRRRRGEEGINNCNNGAARSAGVHRVRRSSTWTPLRLKLEVA